MAEAVFPKYRYAWNRMGRKGQICTVLCRGKMNSCLVEFDDGYRAVTSRNALRKAAILPQKESGPEGRSLALTSVLLSADHHACEVSSANLLSSASIVLPPCP